MLGTGHPWGGAAIIFIPLIVDFFMKTDGGYPKEEECVSFLRRASADSPSSFFDFLWYTISDPRSSHGPYSNCCAGLPLKPP